MYIRRTTIKSRRTGEPYYTYRLVESLRTADGVRQRTLLNLGRHFDVPRDRWAALAQRIEQLASGQATLGLVQLPAGEEELAQRYAAQVVHARSREQSSEDEADYQTVDVSSVDVVRPRSIGVEHAAMQAIRQLGLNRKLQELGFNGPQRAAALGNIVARMAAPGSERATDDWLKHQSGLGELIDFAFEDMNPWQLYRASDRLLKHKDALESFLYARERTLFDFEETITLYDLTNTYFEGIAATNPEAKLGHSKEKRSDCPLVTLALVLDASGFPKSSEIFPGNAREPQTLEKMLSALHHDTSSPTVVLDAGIATEENVAWLSEHGYRYVVVSRKRQRRFDPEQATLIKEADGVRIRGQRIVNPDTGEVELYCHSSQRQKKEEGIHRLVGQRLEAELQKLAEGLHKKRTTKRYDKVLERIGRLRQKYPRAAQYYTIDVQHDPDSGLATAIAWTRATPVDDTLPGVYCLRSNCLDWDEATLWSTYIMLTDLEAVFRSLKSELGLRPVFHRKKDRVRGHLFISVLAYHLVHSIRFQLQACEIDLSWASLRRQLCTQQRVTVELKRADGRTIHVRRATRAEPRQQVIYDALGIAARPGKTETTVI